MEKSQDKSKVVAYTLWITLGWAGAHRFYTGKWLTGIIYLSSLGIFGLGWFFDAFFVSGMVDEAQEKIEKIKRESPELLEEDEVEEIASWASKTSIGAYVEFPIRFLFYIFAPAFFALFALGSNHYELIVIMAVIVVATSFTHSAKRILRLYPVLENMPVLGDAFAILKNLNTFYLENRPKSFVFYLGYIFFGFLSMPFSKTVRKEFSMYQKIIVTVALVAAAQIALSYLDVYPPFLSWEDALLVIATEFFLLFFLVVTFMMPVVATSFQLSLSGRKSMLRVLTFMAIASTFFGIAAHYNSQQDQMSLISNQLIGLRMDKKEFVEEITNSSEMFISYYIKKAPQSDSSEASIMIDENLTSKYREHIVSLAKNDEANAFTVIKMNNSLGKWYGISYQSVGPRSLICMVDSKGNFYTTWSSLPPEVQNLFYKEAKEGGTIQETSKASFIADFTLVDDRK